MVSPQVALVCNLTRICRVEQGLIGYQYHLGTVVKFLSKPQNAIEVVIEYTNLTVLLTSSKGIYFLLEALVCHVAGGEV